MAKQKVIEPNDSLDPGAPLVGAATYTMNREGLQSAVSEYFARRGVATSSITFHDEDYECGESVRAVVTAEQQPVELQVRRRRRQSKPPVE